MKNVKALSFSGMHDEIRDDAIDAFARVYDSKWYVLGEEVRKFETSYAALSQTRFCVGLSNGLEAIHLSLKALGIGKGDEVIVASNSYIASVLSLSYVGAIPVFVEPDIRTFNLDPKLIRAAISSKTKAILPVHLYGQACEMVEIMDIASEFKLFVVEDNAQAHGARFNKQLTGSFGDLNATSFYPSKNLGALGDAGAVTTNSEVLFKKVQTLRNYGSQKRYFNEVIGHNARLDEVQAAILRLKLKYLEKWNLERVQIANRYSRGLASIEGLSIPYIHPQASHVFHQYVIRTDRRDELQAHLLKNGIETLIHYPIPPHLQECYRDLGYEEGDFPIAEELARSVLSLPIYPGLSETEIDYVVEKIAEFF